MFEMLLVLAGAAVGVALLVALGYGLAWAVLHGRRDGPGWERLDGFRYAHRGLHGCGVPENSLAAFRRAAEAGYGAELDVHLTRDGRLAVIHDGDLRRMCGVSGRVEEKTAAELSALRLAGTEERIPFLEEVLPLFAGRAPLVVELKTDWRSAAELACRTVECLDRFSIDYCVESFDPRPLLWLRRHRPNVLRGQLSQNFHRHPSGQGLWNRLALTNLLYNVFTRPDFVAYRFGDQERLAVRLCRRSGVRMAYWTLRSWADIILAEQEGALVIFEEPDQLKEEPC